MVTAILFPSSYYGIDIHQLYRNKWLRNGETLTAFSALWILLNWKMEIGKT